MWQFMNPLRRRAALMAAAAALALAACGGGGDGGAAGSGTLRLALTDAPACGYDAVYVTVEKVRVHQSSNAGEGDAGWSEVVLTPPLRVDLLSLQNGVLAELGQMPLPAGRYTQMRLVLAANGGAQPPANALVLTGGGGAQIALTTPSAQQSGLKMNVNIEVASGALADFVLDFDACKSIVRAGNSGRYLLKPVVSVIPRYVSGVSGYVEASLASGATSVSLQQGGVIVRATTPDATGRFLLQPVAPGSYDLVLTAPGRATAVVTGVVVAAGTVTPITTLATALVLPTSASGTAAGAVSTGVTPIDATLRATQSLTGGVVIEVAGGPVDSELGSYSHVLPVGAPSVAAFVPAGGALIFAADAAAAGNYTLVAASGTSTLNTAITLADGATVTTDFVFP